MSRETNDWLRNNILRGCVEKRGRAWWGTRADMLMDDSGMSNHYDGPIPTEDILSRLFNFNAVPVATYYDTPDGIRRDESTMTWVRDDTYAKLGAHTPGYAGHGYREWLVDNLGKLVGGGAEFANAGLLSGGAVAWVQIERPDNVELAGGVTIRPFILATTSFDGSTATTFKEGFTDVVCDNTRDMFMREAGAKYKVKHTRYSKFSITDAATALSTLDLIAENASAEVERLINIDVTDVQWQRFVEAHVPIADDAKANGRTLAENKRQAITGLWNTDARVTPWRNTAWGAIQAVNTFNTHMSIVRNVERAERNMSDAIKGKIGAADRAAFMQLSDVLGRTLISV